MGCYWGGTENYEFSLAQHLVRVGHEVDFLIGAPLVKRIQNLNKISDFSYHVIKSPFLKDISQKFYSWRFDKIAFNIFRLDNYLFSVGCFQTFKSILNDNYDVIQISGQVDLAYLIKKYLIKKKINSKVFLFFPGMPDIRKVNLIKAIDGVFTDGYAYYILKEIHPHCQLIYGGIYDKINFSIIGRKKIRNKFGISDTEKLIIMVNRLVYLKGLSVAIDIVKILKNKYKKFKLLIVGDGPDRKRILRDVKNYNLGNIILMSGQVQIDKISDYYSAGDIFMCTSFYDNFPNSIKEAFRIGLPVVASKNSGIEMQVVDGENGFLCQTISDYVNKIVLLLSDDLLRKKISKNNIRKAINKYNWNKSIKKYIKFINYHNK